MDLDLSVHLAVQKCGGTLRTDLVPVNHFNGCLRVEYLERDDMNPLLTAYFTQRRNAIKALELVSNTLGDMVRGYLVEGEG